MNFCNPPVTPTLPSEFIRSRCRRDISPLAVELICDVTQSRAPIPANLNSDSESESESGSGSDSDSDNSSDEEEESSSSASSGSTPTDTLYLHRLEERLISCANHEICVDGYGPPELWEFGASVAWCVSTSNFVEIAKEKIAHITEDVSDIEGPSNVVEDIIAGTASMGIEAVLTSPDQGSSMYARKMQIKAQGYEKAFNTQLWRSLANGTTNCHQCTSLDLTPLPEGTKRIKVDIMMSGRGVISGGLLYLFHVHSQKQF